MRQQREAERAKIAEEARLKMQREEEAARRREQRKAEDRARNPTASRVASGDGPGVWRRPSAANPTPPTPVRAASALPRTESPTPPKFRPGSVAGTGGGGGGGWREREAAKKAGAGTPLPLRSELPKGGAQ